MPRLATLLTLLCVILAALAPPPAARARQPGSLGVQEFLSAQPGALAGLRDGERSAAAIIEGHSLYYGLSPRLHLALLEATAGLLSDPAPPAERLSRPFGPAGPPGFAAQIEWASRELRAGLGPYSRPPTLRFSDGVTVTLTLEQAPEGVAVQRFLARGRSSAEWRQAVDRFAEAFERYFDNELVQIGDWGMAQSPSPQPASPQPPSPQAPIALLQPWPAGTRVVHLAYFDHVYPTVDSGDDGNGFVVNYLGRGNLQYDGHDGHDYYFPDRPVGSPILAAAAGTAYARTYRGNGVVIIHPGGYETVYWHLDEFAPIFADLVDSGQGVAVRAGDLLGTSGTSGFVRGTPHLHFEVRHLGKQVDPYGWYGPGADPCLAYAGCAPSAWLWHPSLAGTYDFTPPGSPAPRAPAPPRPDTNPPSGTLSVAPPAGLLFQADFDGHAVQTVGQGFPLIDGALRFAPGRAGEALALGQAGLTYPTAGNLRVAAGTIALWAELPERYPASGTKRHYLFAASASADGAPVYSGTLALRRDLLGPGDSPQWTFWTNGADEASRDLLSAPDTLGAGWHHFAVTWDAAGRKALYIDGALAAESVAAELPRDVGQTLQLGRFTYGGAPAGANIDDLRIFGQALDAAAIAGLMAEAGRAEAGPPTLTGRSVRLDTNAIDPEGGIVAVQLGRDGEFADPQPYYDSYRWLMPNAEGEYTLAVRYFDRAGNSATISRTVQLDLPPRADLGLEEVGAGGATLLIAAEDDHGPIMMQVSQRISFADAEWQPLRERVFWAWEEGRPRRLYVRLRDANGNTSLPMPVAALDWSVHLPLIQR